MIDEHVKVLSTWHQEPTNSRAITDALANLWRAAARAHQTESPNVNSDELRQTPIRTSVLNFVVFAASHGVAERARDVTAHLSVTHPSRSISIVAQPDDPSSSLGASLNAQCHADAEGRPRFCFEQIDLTARGGTVQHLPGVVTQLLIHDLPTLLWWPGEPPVGDPFFRAMAGVCDRLIVDSSDFSDPEGMLAALAEYGASEGGHGLLSDLNWDRLIDWREMLAQFFDAAPAQPYLRQVRRVAILCAFDPAGQHSSAQALLLAGWLASRLGWATDTVAHGEGGECQVRLHAGGEPIEVQIASSNERRASPGALVSVQLIAGDLPELATFSVEASGDGEHGTTRVALPGVPPVSRTVRLEPASESALISEEMEAFGRERAYDDALRATALLVRGGAAERPMKQ
jgi:glucose-6-phosphate dehydrogenase assembly protein OpcA